MVRDDGLGNSLADGIHLGRVPTALDTDTNVDASKLVLADDKNGLVHFEAEDFRLDEVYGRAIDTDESAPFPGVCDGGCGLVVGSKKKITRKGL